MGLPQTLRNSQKADFAPRFGFAWRPLGNDRTVIRGGYRKYIETLLGAAMFSQWGVPTSYNGQFTNSFVNGKPTLTFPYPFPSSLAAAPGTAQFLAGIDSNYKDPYVQQWNFTVERDLGFSTAVRLSYGGSHGSELGYYIDGNQIPANTVGYSALAASGLYPSWPYVKLNINGARSNYDAFTVVANRRFSRGLQVYAGYIYTKNLSNEAGYNPTAFTGENGGSVSDRYNINLDYGNVAFTRRDRFQANFLYDLPFGKGRGVLNRANRALDGIVGGWELAGVLLFQTGPVLTVTVPGADPAGNNFDNSIGSGGGGVGSGRADIVSGVPLYPSVQSASLWINKAAFAVPPNNIGRDPDSPVGAVVGPGTQSVSVSLFKSKDFQRGARIVPLDRERRIGHVAPGVDVPLRPFFGGMGVAPPPSMGKIRSGPPGIHAGNLDNRDLAEGSTLYIPVHVAGALFQVGDGHAAQGEGEVDRHALETSLTGTFQFIVRHDMHLKWPRAETPTHYIAMGLDPDLNEAAKLAILETIDFLMTEKKMSHDDAYVLASVGVDFVITQCVDGTLGVHSLIPNSLFQSRN